VPIIRVRDLRWRGEELHKPATCYEMLSGRVTRQTLPVQDRQRCLLLYLLLTLLLNVPHVALCPPAVQSRA